MAKPWTTHTPASPVYATKPLLRQGVYVARRRDSNHATLTLATGEDYSLRTAATAGVEVNDARSSLSPPEPLDSAALEWQLE
jgi:hypothetical protein